MNSYGYILSVVTVFIFGIMLFASIGIAQFTEKKNSLQGIFTIGIVGLVGILIAMGIVILMPLQCSMNIFDKEGFQNIPTATYVGCPDETVAYTDIHGNTNCCDGTVNGTKCEGTTICTFSGNAMNLYPMCSNTRKRKWFGPIDAWVKAWLKDFYVVKFNYVLLYMDHIIKRIQEMDRKHIRQSAVDKLNDLLKEEVDWFIESKKQKSIAYQEEIMYIMNELINILRNEPIFQNQFTLQQELQKQACQKT
jgi:hypothetical protein